MPFQKRKALAALRTAPALHRLLQRFFSTETPPLPTLDREKAISYFQAYDRRTSASAHHPEFFEELQKRGIQTDRRYQYSITSPIAFNAFPSPSGPCAPLHVAALGRTHDRIIDKFNLENRKIVGHQPEDESYYKALESMDMQSGPSILRDTYITVLHISALLAYNAKSAQDFIAIMKRNLEPRREPEARGFSSLELLSNTINGFWGNFIYSGWEPHGMLDKQGQVSMQFIAAVHSLIRKHPDSYHGGCPNRYVYDGQTISAVEESFRIFLEEYEQAMKELKPHEKAARRQLSTAPKLLTFFKNLNG